MKNLIDPITLSRREFCSTTCRAATALAALAVSGCGGGPTSPSFSNAANLAAVPSSVSGRTIAITVDAASALASVGQAAIVQNALGSFLVARVAQDSFNAMTAVCTHDGCTVTGFASSRFVCPCHGSEFTTAGAVAQGPAARPLLTYATTLTGDVLTFTV